jgi:hypothetical protein
MRAWPRSRHRLSRSKTRSSARRQSWEQNRCNGERRVRLKHSLQPGRSHLSEKNFPQCVLVMTHARHFAAQMTHVQPGSAVLDDECFVAAVSCDHSPIAATDAGFSIATTAAPSPGIPRCNSAPSDAPAENSFRIPLTNTAGFAVFALGVLFVACCLGVDFFGRLTDLDWGSWEGSLPESSSLGGDRTPLRGAFIIDPVFSIRDSRTHCGKNSINFDRLATFS